MRLAECDEMVQCFVFNRLNKSFDPGIQIERADRQPLRLDAVVFHKLLEFGRDFCVSIMNQAGQFLISLSNVVYECFDLFRAPV